MYDMKLNNSLPDLQELPQLRHIELGSNNFDSFTDVFAGLASRLVYLSFHSNPNIRGTFPQSVARMVNLRDILMNGNRITGPIPDLRSLTQITTCNLGPLSTCLPFSNKAEYIASQPLPCRSSLDALVICADAQVFNPNEQPSETLETSESTATTDPTSSTTVLSKL
ncbi:hypothetical protein BC829DRAFT_144355 [Chytridium lagenaria]|nr:hypothetical protein BC829DRAFT_144355 [Chytridium lagenaria]